MASSPRPLPVVCLGGPTGSGKTGLAIEIAKRLDCEIINADSRQVYADFPIITAQPDAEERRAATHHLYGYLSTWLKTDAGQWRSLAFAKAKEILKKGKIPLVTGGTGLYFHALLHGLADIPPVDAAISALYDDRMESAGPLALYKELQGIDPAYAARIHPHDRQRIQRALEVHAATGKTFSWWHAQSAGLPLCAGPFYFIDLPLGSIEKALYDRIGQMLERGALLETERAWAACPVREAPGWSGIGCRECLSLYHGLIGREECQKVWYGATRAYAKRQLTWFRGRRGAKAITKTDLPGICTEIEKWARNADFSLS